MNISFIFSCPNDSERSKVQFFLNERPIEFNWCHVGLCNLSRLTEMYQKFLGADCEKTFCGGSSSVNLKMSALIVVFVGLITRLF